MKQIAFLIDVSWLQDDETTAAVRYSCLQFLTAWPSDRCKFGYLLFDSEASRNQKVNPVNFVAPTTSLVEEFEARLGQGCPTAEDRAVRLAHNATTSSSQLETIRWAVARSVTDFDWHAVSVSSPVKSSRKRRASSALCNAAAFQSSATQCAVEEDQYRNLLFVFARLPAGTLARIRDELVTTSLRKCLQESRIDLTWVHDSIEPLHSTTTATGASNTNGNSSSSSSSSSSSNKCRFLRMRDLVQLCGIFATEHALASTSLAAPSAVVGRLLQARPAASRSATSVCYSCTVSLCNDSLKASLSLSVYPVQTNSPLVFDCADLELVAEDVVDEPNVTAFLQRSRAVFFATSTDVRFHRTLAELRSEKKIMLLSYGQKAFMLKFVTDSVGALVHLTEKLKSRGKIGSSEVLPESLFHGYLLERWLKVEPSPGNLNKTRLDTMMNRLATVYNASGETTASGVTPAEEAELKPQEEPDRNTASGEQDESSSLPPDNYNSETALLQGLRHIYTRGIEGKLGLTTAAQSIVSAVVHFFSSDFPNAISFIEANFQPPLQSSFEKVQWASECRLYILISFEMACLCPTSTGRIKAHVVATMRKLLFLTSPRDLFDFIRETLKGLYLESVRPLLEEIADEFDLPLFPESDEDEDQSSMGSFADPLSGISSLGAGSIINSVPRSAPVTSRADAQHGAAGLRRLSSANLSQQSVGQPRQIEIPRRRSIRVKAPEHRGTSTSASSQSPQKNHSFTRGMPTTPRGKRILKTQVVPETPVAKQAPDRIRRNQERLRKRSSILNLSQGGGTSLDDNDDAVDEIEESPVKECSTPKRTASPRKSARLKVTPTSEDVVHQARQTPAGPSPTRKSQRTTPRKTLSRQLRFSPQKRKAFTSPTAISLLHLTTSPVLYKHNKTISKKKPDD